MSNILLILLTIIVIVLLVFIYKKREETESNLGFKIVGYYLLSAFTFRLNEFPLPLGFIVFLLFFRPTKNVKTKQSSAYLGLAIFIIQLIIPAVDEYIYERSREVAGASNNIFQVSFTKDWITIKDQMEIDPDARLENFKAEYEKNGQIIRLSYDLVSRSEDGFIYYDIGFSSETKEYTIRRHKVGDQWLQYDRSVFASRFFEVLDQAQVRNLPLKHSFEENILTSDGEMTSYAVEDRYKYLIQGKEIKEITNDQLPIKGYYITSCGIDKTHGVPSGSTISYSCENEADYFFDAVQKK